jgi:hypothetical protein
MLCDTVTGIYYHAQSTKDGGVSAAEIAPFIGKMPCQSAGEAFQPANKRLCKDMVSNIAYSK